MTKEWWYSPEVAREYEQWYYTPRGRLIDEQEKALLLSLLPGEHRGSLLDVGCGTGHFTRFFACLGYRALGVDISQAMVRQAKKKALLPYVRGDALMLPFPDSSFDIVSAITTLEFITKPEMMIAEMIRVSRGNILFGILNSLSPMGIRRRLELLIGRENPYLYARFYSPFSLKRLIYRTADDIGVKVKEVSYKTTVFPCKKGVSPLVLPFGAFIGMVVVFNG
jgi:ubiquinone/menaquinone biosynthesis C-methylase UbiE